MHVEMWYCLTPIHPAIRDETETIFGNSKFISNFHGSVSQDGNDRITLLDLADGINVFFGYQDNVNGSLGLNIVKRQCFFILENDARRDFLPDEPAKKTVLYQFSTRPNEIDKPLNPRLANSRPIFYIFPRTKDGLYHPKPSDQRKKDHHPSMDNSR